MGCGLVALALAVPAAAAPARPAARVVVSPGAVQLTEPEGSAQLAVLVGGRDLTRAAAWSSADPRVAAVDAAGRVHPRGDGETRVLARFAGGVGEAVVRVRIARPAPVSFERDVLPVLTRAGCNAGGCHGKAEGKGGLKLTIFSYDPAADHHALRGEGGGRRVQVADPPRSLMLRKAAAQVPHGGGRRLEAGSPGYRLLARWIREGARYEAAPPPRALVIEPAAPLLRPGEARQLRVLAVEADGSRRCVTALAEFKANEPAVAEVDEGGQVKAAGPVGEAPVVIRYRGQVAVARVTVPRPGVRFVRPPERGFVDRLVWDRLQRLGIRPSGLAPDAVFLRRAYLDVIGALPTAAEARDFLAACAAERGPDAARPAPRARERLVEALLARPEYADYWAHRWPDLLRVDPRAVTQPGAFAFTRWLRRQFAENRPYDAFAREVLTARGNVAAEGPAAFYKALEKPEVMSRSVSQLFLGVRIECAECHQHPSERWSQGDYYALAGFFTGVAFKKLPEGEAVVAAGGSDLKHPRTGEPVPARALGAPPAALDPDGDRRAAFAAWLTDPANPWFARAAANRLWAHFLGRGLVEPVDDFRAGNPATNEPLLTALAEHLRASGYDLKALMRVILTSHTYQAAATPDPTAVGDTQGYSHAQPRRLPAEVLLDAICQVTGVPEEFEGWPRGYRAIQVWDSRLPSYFLRLFGRPLRTSVCECERSGEPSIAQALHLMNAPEIAAKIRSRDGTARRLAGSDMPPEAIVEELCLAALSRPPTPADRRALLPLFTDAGRTAAVEDVLWALLNSPEFLTR